MNKELLKDFENVVNEHKYSMFHLMIYYCLKCNDEFESLSDDEIISLISFIYDAYMQDDNHTDLSYLCDRAILHKDDIMKNDYNVFNKYDLLDECYNNVF